MFYTISNCKETFSDSSFHKLTLSVRQGNSYSEQRQDVTFVWQGNVPFGHWYGLKIELDTDTSEGLAWAGRLISKLGKLSYVTPESVIELAKTRKVYDSRTSSFVEPENVPDPTLHSWRDDYQRLGNACCMVGGLASDTFSAQNVLTAQYLKLLANGNSDYARKFAEWVEAGKPVFELGYDHAPEVKPIESILNPTY